jgi:hypothetical protein
MQRRAELRQLVWRAIEEEWDRTRPPGGGVGETLSKSIYDRLIAEWADVPPGAMDEILQNLHDRPLNYRPTFSRQGEHTDARS